MPSFDIVSKINLQEVDNAVNQARKELATRYDFRGSKSRVDWDKEKINLTADDDFKMRALTDILKEKALRRGVDVRALDFGKIEEAGLGLMKREVLLKQGVPIEIARDIVSAVKASKLKIQVQIQEDQLRVSGKKRDDLQEAIALIKSKAYNIPLQFVNYRE